MSCAAGLAAMQIIEDEGLLDNCREKAQWLMRELGKPGIKKWKTVVTAVRGVGLMIGVEITSAEIARILVDRCRKAGLILETNLLAENIIRFSPALNVGWEECAIAVQTFADTVDDYNRD